LESFACFFAWIGNRRHSGSTHEQNQQQFQRAHGVSPASNLPRHLHRLLCRSAQAASTTHGGRGVYFDDPNGHLFEIITTPHGDPADL
jgi:hypothetical protein